MISFTLISEICLPFLISTTRSQSFATVLSACEEKIMQLPALAQPRIKSWHGAHSAGIQSRHRFVQYPQFGRVNERSHHADLLAHSVRIRGHEVVDRVPQLKNLFERIEALFAKFRGHFVDVHHKRNVLNASHFHEHGVIIGDKSHVHFGFHGFLFDIVTRDRDAAFFKRQHPLQTFQRGRLPCAVVAQKPHDLSLVTRKRHVFDRIIRFFRVLFIQALNLHDRGRVVFLSIFFLFPIFVNYSFYCLIQRLPSRFRCRCRFCRLRTMPNIRR